MDVEKTIEFLLNNQAAADVRLSRLEAIVAANSADIKELKDLVAANSADNKVIKELVVSNTKDIKDLASMVGTLAQSMMESGKRFDEQDRKLGVRIDSLASGFGEFIRRINPPLPPTN